MAGNQEALKVICRFLGVGICVISAFLIVALAIVYRNDRRNQQSWVETDAEVVNHEVVFESTRTGDLTSEAYNTRFLVHYQANGQTMLSKVEVGYGTNNRAEMEKWADMYPNGSHVRVRFNPENPSQLRFSDQQAGMAYVGERQLGISAVVLLLGGVLLIFISKKMGSA